jgi:serine-type D-Ala-D-Ala carboxypeptidase/endopeptidase (penicillin-binding protein 4)
VRALLLAALLISAANAALPPPITRALAQSRVPAQSAAYFIADAKTGAVLLSHQADKPMNPASVMKLITTAAALDTLTADYVWRTEFLSVGSAIDGVLSTPLYIRASGDPKITWEHLEAVFQRLRARGIVELRGGVVVDTSVFAPATYNTAAFDARTLRPYNVSPHPMLFNFKAVGFKLFPDATNNTVNIVPEPHPEGVTLEARVKLVRGPCADWRSRLGARFEDGPQSARVTFDGTYALECGDREWFVSLLDHDAFFEGSIRWAWKKVGGGSVGAVRSGPIPPEAKTLEVHSSLPLIAAVADVNKFSNNVMARHLLLTIDRIANGAPAQVPRGVEAIKRWLMRRQLAMPELVIENGSGLSRDERVSAQGLGALLRFAATQPYASAYMQSLPLAGVDGSLTERFVGSRAQGTAYLKTGSIDAVRTLAGYLNLPGGRQLVYIALINHANAQHTQAALEAGVEWAYAQ